MMIYLSSIIVRMEVISILVITLSVLIVSEANSAPVTFKFSGTVFQVDAQLSGVASVGDKISGSYTFDSASPDLAPTDPTFGDYLSATPYSVAVGSFSSSGTGVTFNIFDNLVLGSFYRDQYRAVLGNNGPKVNGLVYNGFSLDLWTQLNYQPTTLSSDRLPTVAPSIGTFQNNQLRFYFINQNNGVYYIIGDITSMTTPCVRIVVASEGPLSVGFWR